MLDLPPGILASSFRPAATQNTARRTDKLQFVSRATCYLTWDHLGTPRLVTDQNGNVVARHDYLPFGEEISGNTAGRTSQWGQRAIVWQAER